MSASPEPSLTKRCIKVGLVIIAIIVLYNLMHPSGHWDYRMTITVQTPEGIKIGSSVREISVSSSAIPADSGLSSTVHVRGEAVAVDLGTRGILFALLKSPNNLAYARQVFFDVFPVPGDNMGRSTPKGIYYYSFIKQEGQVVLSSKELPMFVRFRDLKDPTTLEVVNPDDLAASFGEGVKLLETSIEITNEPVTTGLENILPIFGSRFADWQRTVKYSDPLHLNVQDFVRR